MNATNKSSVALAKGDPILELEALMRDTNALLLRAGHLFARVRGRDLVHGLTVDNSERIIAIIGIVCRKYNLSATAVFRNDRHSEISEPRSMAMALSVQLVPAPQCLIAKAFKRDRATIAYAVRAVRNRCETDKLYRHAFSDCLTQCKKELGL